MISKKESTLIKGIAIISIILSHFWGWILSIPDCFFPAIRSISQAGVIWFLLLSGYGLKHSYNQKGLTDFWRRRLVRIYVPLLIVTIPQVILRIWNYRNNIRDMYMKSTFLSMLGIYPCNVLDGTLWYISFLLIEYIVFYIAYRFTKKKWINYLVILLGTIIGYILFKKYYIWVNTCDLYAFAFSIGIVLQDKWKTNEKKIVGGWLALPVFILTVILGNTGIYYLINQVAIVIMEYMIVHTFLIKCKRLYFLEFFGKYSFELYLTEAFFFMHKGLYELFGNNYFGLLCHIIIIALISFILQRLSSTINNIIAKRIKY